MAPVLSQTPVPVPVPVPPKSKRPVPSGIQTNSVSSLKSSPSPNMSNKRPPTTNGVGPPSARPQNRRRDTSNQIMGRGQRSAGLRSASLVPPDSAVPGEPEPVPYVLTQKYILKKFPRNLPSLIVHLHPNHFRFDQQTDTFAYKTPMSEVFLAHLKARTVPHELMTYFDQWGVQFYDGCLIVQVHDHKSLAQAKEVQRPSSGSSKTVPFSINNVSPYLTPSPYGRLQKGGKAASDDKSEPYDADAKEKTAEEKDKENMPAPSMPEGSKGKNGGKAKITTIVLRPTEESRYADLQIKASTPLVSADGRADGAPPPTPHAIVPPTPTAASMPPPAKRQKREKMELDGSNIYEAEAQILLATTPKLDLEPTKNAEELIRRLESMAHPDHSHDPPQPKTRKRTVAEMAADDALAADQERYMLTLDERLSSKASNAQGASGVDGEGQAGGAVFEARFNRFQVIEGIKRDHAEKKEQERQKAAEKQAQMAAQKNRQQEQDLERQRQQQLIAQQQARAQKAAEEQALQQQREQQLREQVQAQQEQQRMNEARRRAMQAQAQAQAQSQAAQQNTIAATMGQTPHAHPAHSPAMPNGTPVSMAGQPGLRFHNVQVSGPPVSSPIIRQNTPQSASSPMVPHVPMQQSNSSMGQSPPRPGSAVPMSIPMTASMSARGSQQSHANGTPRMHNATPNMAHGTPINRSQMVNTPRMSQASPPPGMITAQQQLGNAMLMNGQNVPMHNAAAIAAQQRMMQQQQQQIAVLRHQQGGGMVPGNPNQMQHQQQQLMQQQMMRQQMLSAQRAAAAGQMVNPQAHNQALVNQYAQQLTAMQNGNLGHLNQVQRAQQLAAIAAQQGQGQGMMGMNGMNPSQIQQLQAMQRLQQQQQQQQQQQMQQQGQHQPQMGQPGNLLQHVQLHIQQNAKQIFQGQLQNHAERYGGTQQIPPDVHENIKKQCFARANANIINLLRQGQLPGLTPQQSQQAFLMLQQRETARQQQQQQQQQQQASAMQGMMSQGMSMP